MAADCAARLPLFRPGRATAVGPPLLIRPTAESRPRNTVVWTHMSQPPKRHLDRFSRAQLTRVPNRQTDHATCDI